MQNTVYINAAATESHLTQFIAQEQANDPALRTCKWRGYPETGEEGESRCRIWLDSQAWHEK